MQENPNVRVAIAGHADISGDPTYNKWLSEWRAQAVAKYLMDKGIQASRIEVEFYGAEKPAESNDTREGRSKNRRVEFTILEK
jgi:OOP family OmpA-OmpF porin